MKYEDEDMGYEMQRQARIDAKLVPNNVNQVIIGSQLKDCDKIQRSVHHDPAPELPFQEGLETLPEPWFVALLFLLAIVIMVGVMWVVMI